MYGATVISLQESHRSHTTRVNFKLHKFKIAAKNYTQWALRTAQRKYRYSCSEEVRYESEGGLEDARRSASSRMYWYECWTMLILQKQSNMYVTKFTHEFDEEILKITHPLLTVFPLTLTAFSSWARWESFLLEIYQAKPWVRIF